MESDPLAKISPHRLIPGPHSCMMRALSRGASKRERAQTLNRFISVQVEAHLQRQEHALAISFRDVGDSSRDGRVVKLIRRAWTLAMRHYVGSIQCWRPTKHGGDEIDVDRPKSPRVILQGWRCLDANASYSTLQPSIVLQLKATSPYPATLFPTNLPCAHESNDERHHQKEC